MIIGSLSRVLAVIETLGRATAGMSAADIVARSGLPTSTVYRMLGEMEEQGLLYRTADRLYYPNYSFERRLALATVTPATLLEVCHDVSGALHTAAEVILLRGQNLLWHLVEQHPDQAIQLRAHPGFVRSTYELDSITRLSLAHLAPETIARDWDVSAFFEVGVAGGKVGFEEVRTRIAAVDIDDMQFDMQGNAKGVRRYCVAVRDGDGRFICLLTVAEAATPLRDERAHVARIRDTLTAARTRLTDAGDKELASRKAGRL